MWCQPICLTLSSHCWLSWVHKSYASSDNRFQLVLRIGVLCDFKSRLFGHFAFTWLVLDSTPESWNHHNLIQQLIWFFFYKNNIIVCMDKSEYHPGLQRFAGSPQFQRQVNAGGLRNEFFFHLHLLCWFLFLFSAVQKELARSLWLFCPLICFLVSYFILFVLVMTLQY